jgi:hypothetical protein
MISIMEDWEYKLLLISTAAVLFFLLLTIGEFRTYRRTKMVSFFLLTLSGITCIIGISGSVTWLITNLHSFRQGHLNLWIIPFLFLLTVGGFLGTTGITLRLTVDSGLWKEICDNTSFWQRLLGDVPITPKKQYSRPIGEKRLFLIGFVLLVGGVLTILLPFFFGMSIMSNDIYIGLFVASFTSISEGVLLIVFLKRKRVEQQRGQPLT